MTAEVRTRVRQKVTDRELVTQAQTGFQWAFEELYQRHLPKVKGLLFRMFRGRSCSLDEVAQDVFMSAYRSLPAFKGESQFSTWLHAVTRNHALQRLKKDQRDACCTTPLEGLEPMLYATRPALDDHAASKIELAAALEQAALLPPLQRQALRLRLRGLDYIRIGQLLGVHADVVKGRVHRAREALRAQRGPA